jgi:hypothetical protein
MRPAKYFYDKPLHKHLDPKTVLIYRLHPVYCTLLRGGGGGGQKEGTVEGQQYTSSSSFIHRGNSSQAGPNQPWVNVSLVYKIC